jgi:hypothetical protein
LGISIGFVPEAVVQGAFFALWVRKNPGFCDKLSEHVRQQIET